MILFATLLVSYFSLHSLLADDSVKRYLKFYLVSKRYYRLLFNAIAVVALIPLIISYRTLNKTQLLDSNLLKWLGAIMVLFGIVLMWQALKGYNLSAFAGTYQYKTGEEETADALITSGLNAHVRHPLYFATLLLVWGSCLFRPHLPMLLIAIITTLYLWIGTRLEEQKLIRQFGIAYKNYQKSVPMLIPLKRLF